MTRHRTPGRVQDDPTGDLRATYAARLEYDLSPVYDERRDATYRETPETLHADRLRALRKAMAEGRVYVEPAEGVGWGRVTGATLHLDHDSRADLPADLVARMFQLPTPGDTP